MATSRISTIIGIVIIIALVCSFFFCSDDHEIPENYILEMTYRKYEIEGTRYFLRGEFPILDKAKISINDNVNDEKNITITSLGNEALAVRVNKSKIWWKRENKWMLRVVDYNTSNSKIIWGPKINYDSY